MEIKCFLGIWDALLMKNNPGLSDESANARLLINGALSEEKDK